MKTFGLSKKINKTRKYYIKFINITYISLLIICFSIFSLYYNLTRIVFSTNKVDIVTEKLEDIAFYFRNFDKELSNTILTLNDIIQDYIQNKNILTTRKNDIENVRIYIRKHKDYLNKLGFSNYNTLIKFVSELRTHQKEIFQLLGENQEFNYLIILQNTNEKRPNGGFFGSFAFLTIKQGHIKELEIIDSYYPDFIAYKTYLLAPQRTQAFLPERKIGFIAANKFGFTDIDGKNIKDLYEKMFNETFVMRKVKKTMEPDLYNKLLHKYIKGVIFIRSDLLEYIIPGFTKKIRERQFLNASIDLIRGETRGNKKELYIKEIKDYFDKNKFTIIKKVIQNFDEILNRNYIQIYLSNVSTGLNSLLQENHLTNIFSSGNIYARDTNSSYNKVDNFIHKNIQIRDSNNNIVLDTHNDIVPIKNLKPGIYNMRILYTLNIPYYYQQFIKTLEKKYKITLTQRELGILALQQSQPKPEDEPKRWETKATIYFPLNIKILAYGGDSFDHKKFQTPFANGLFYKMKIHKNNISKSISIKFEIK